MTPDLAVPDLVENIVIVRKPAARRLRLTVDPRSGTVRLVMPKRAALAPALEWVREQRSWIEAQQAKLPSPWPITPGMILPFAGQEMVLDWAETNPRGPKLAEGRLMVGGPLDLLAQRLERWLRREAKRVLEAETREFASIAGVSIGRVSIGDPRSRWGSCAASGDIRYSWRLILAPADVRRATVAHEVAHRLHMDHSPAFHAAVERIYGEDPKPMRRWLKANGARLHWFGAH
jgi:predicted metal-dependent hydrolase